MLGSGPRSWMSRWSRSKGVVFDHHLDGACFDHDGKTAITTASLATTSAQAPIALRTLTFNARRPAVAVSAMVHDHARGSLEPLKFIGSGRSQVPPDADRDNRSSTRWKGGGCRSRYLRFDVRGVGVKDEGHLLRAVHDGLNHRVRNGAVQGRSWPSAPRGTPHRSKRNHRG